MTWKSIVEVEIAKTYIQLNAPQTWKIVQEFLELNKNYQLDSIGKLKQATPYMPDLIDLARLHSLIIEEKRTTVLEFGCGFSTLIMAEALASLACEDSCLKLTKARRNNLHQIISIDDQESFIAIAKDRLPVGLSEFVKFVHSEVECSTHDSRVCTLYSQLPICMPDLIYIDGPDQFNVKGDVRGWSTRSVGMVPMSADLISLEYILPSGCYVIIDGRGANVQFLRDYLNKNWKYEYYQQVDQHSFLLECDSFGKYNDILIDYHKGL